MFNIYNDQIYRQQSKTFLTMIDNRYVEYENLL